MVLFDAEKERIIAVLQDMALLSRQDEHANRMNLPADRPGGWEAAYRRRNRYKYEGAQLVLSALYGPNITTLMIAEAEARAAKVR